MNYHLTPKSNIMTKVNYPAHGVYIKLLKSSNINTLGRKRSHNTGLVASELNSLQIFTVNVATHCNKY